jgi:hypothetical protein
MIKLILIANQNMRALRGDNSDLDFCYVRVHNVVTVVYKRHCMKVICCYWLWMQWECANAILYLLDDIRRTCDLLNTPVTWGCFFETHVFFLGFLIYMMRRSAEMMGARGRKGGGLFGGVMESTAKLINSNDIGVRFK